MDDKLSRSVTYLKGVGPKKAEIFKKVGVETVYDLLQYCPRDYIDLTEPIELRQVRAGTEEPMAVRARLVKKLPTAHIRKGLTISKAVFTDDTADVTVIIFNQDYFFANMKESAQYVLYGRITGNMTRLEMSSPMIFAGDSPDLIMPVYPLTEGLTQQFMRKAVKNAVALIGGGIEDVMPRYLLDDIKLPSLVYAWENVHFPRTVYGAVEARRRLIFDELMIYSLAIAYRRRNLENSSDYVMERRSLSEFCRQLPFEMTAAQRRTASECAKDMMSGSRMNRLIQGDVGSGKTVVAACMAYFTAKNGYQSCMMAPTEILAEQHYKTFTKYLEPLGVRVCLISGGLKPKKKKEIQQALAEGEYDVAVGTHALFYANTQFKNLALVITDEQHRFGVEQRKKLTEKGGSPHTMVMSATPIPRTLALMLYGDLQVSVIDELPAGRQPISTYAVSGKMRARAYGFVKKQLDAGRQGFIVCPAVEETELDIKNAKSYYEELAAGDFKDYRLGLLYGKLSPEEKTRTMEAFKNGEIDLLIATTVVEVGVDVPNATIMVVENADRFGLSQLHQLRGRVGRGSVESFCVLITDNTSPDCIKRMKAISGTNDGFKVAEEDLKLRGPGDFFGTQQHGLPAFKIADLTRDTELLRRAQEISAKIMAEDPKLIMKKNENLKQLVGKLLERGADIS